MHAKSQFSRIKHAKMVFLWMLNVQECKLHVQTKKQTKVNAYVHEQVLPNWLK